MQRKSRVYVSLRMSEEGLEAVSQITRDEHVSRSLVLRACVAVAFKHRAEVVQMVRSLREVS